MKIFWHRTTTFYCCSLETNSNLKGTVQDKRNIDITDIVRGMYAGDEEVASHQLSLRIFHLPSVFFS